MNNSQFLEIIKKLLKTDTDLWFLVESPENDLKTLVACIRVRLYQFGNHVKIILKNSVTDATSNAQVYYL
jgi:hypothetical protein